MENGKALTYCSLKEIYEFYQRGKKKVKWPPPGAGPAPKKPEKSVFFEKNLWHKIRCKLELTQKVLQSLMGLCN